MTPSSKRSEPNAMIKKEESFSKIAKLILASRYKVIQAVNSGPVDLYWNIGQIISWLHLDADPGYSRHSDCEEYAPVTLKAKTFWMPRKIISKSVAEGGSNRSASVAGGETDRRPKCDLPVDVDQQFEADND